MKLAKRSSLSVLLTLLVVSPITVADEAPVKSTADEQKDPKNIYRNVNEDGVVEFSDQNYSDSKKIKLKSTNTFKSAKKKYVTPKVSNNDDDRHTSLDQQSATQYSRIAISSPTADQQIRSNDGLLSVSIAVTPSLNVSAGDQVELYYDGRSQGKQQSTVFNLENVYRGQHRVQAKIMNSSGTVLKISKPIQFVIHKYSVLFNKNKSPKGK